MIKRINLKGISRTPSDRMMEDGGCAESLNFQIQDNESVPVLEAKQVPTSVMPSDYDGKVLYIHKTDSYENYIGYTGSDLVWINGSSSSPTVIISGVDEDIHVKNLGNILICMYGDKCMYVIFRNGEYKSLGGSIPFPELEFTIESQNHGDVTESFDYDQTTEGVAKKNIHFYRMDDTVWNYSKKSILATSETADCLQDVIDIREKIRLLRDSVQEYVNEFTRPVFMKYSVVLYDGSEIDSIPFLVSPDGLKKYTNILFNTTSVGYGETHLLPEDSNDIYPYSFNMHVGILGSRGSVIKLDATNNATIDLLNEVWSDVVKGIRIYMSLDVLPEPIETATSLETVFTSKTCQVTTEGGQGSWAYKYIYSRSGYFRIETDFKKEDFTDKASFFLVDEFNLGDLLAEEQTIDYKSNTNRALGTTLNIESLTSKDSFVPSNVMVYNGRVHATNVDRYLYSGSKNNYSLNGEDKSIARHLMQIAFFVRDSKGVCYTTSFRRMDIYSDLSYIFYPNSNCYKALIKMTSINSTSWFEVPMEVHPLMEGAYFIDINNPNLVDLLDGVKAGTIESFIEYLGDSSYTPETFGNIISDNNKIYQTNTNNFYLYTSVISLSSDIIGLSVNTQALSAGQHGQYPILAFTHDGIWGVSLGSTGAQESVSPLPREVAIKNKIWQVDNATVFVTDKSVNMISGSQVQDLSPFMNGKHYSLESSVEVCLAGTQFASLVSLAKDSNTTFMEFMKQAEMTYDYIGKRLIFFRSDRSYAYALMLNTNTWHKLSLPSGIHFSNVLNSYPKSLVVMDYSYPVSGAVGVVTTNRRCKVYDYSTSLSSTDILSDARHKGIIITRPFDLEEPDILKTIKKIKVRGQYDRTYNELTTVTKVIGKKYRITGQTGDFSDSEFETDIDSIPAVQDFTSYDSIADGTEDLVQMTENETEWAAAKGILDNANVTYTTTDITGPSQVTVTKNTVSYILLGSQDGKNFNVINSLRGKSWKWFRIVILANLKPTERISWIDVDYEPRFNTRLR